MPALPWKKSTINALLAPWGWCVLGATTQADSDWLVLVGNAGPAWWQVFQTQREAQDGLPHPMDRATERIARILSKQLAAKTVHFPFGGPPYAPFLRWAQNSGQAFPSPLGPLIHTDYGLWHAYRAAFVVDTYDPEASPHTSHPCDSCADQPCRTACPVQAIGTGRYDIPVCTDYLRDQPQDCLSQGCAARRACPYAPQYYYGEAESGFHMHAFLTSNAPAQTA